MRIPYVIAEAGSCHEGELSRALDLIKVADECDADAVKFQLWTDPARMRERRRVANPWAYKQGSIEVGWLGELAQAATARDLEFMCTVYLPEDIKVVAPHVAAFKISSFEAGDEAFVAAHEEYDKPLIISTGMMADLPPHLERHTLLHCVSAYPCPEDEAALARVEMRDGYSDHTRHEWAGALAVCAGAKIVEVHYCLADTTDACADLPVSHRPEGLRNYIRNIRFAARMLGTGQQVVQPAEVENLKHRVTG